MSKRRHRIEVITTEPEVIYREMYPIQSMTIRALSSVQEFRRVSKALREIGVSFEVYGTGHWEVISEIHKYKEKIVLDPPVRVSPRGTVWSMLHHPERGDLRARPIGNGLIIFRAFQSQI